MDGHYFLSYSRADGGDFALLLANKLEAGPPSYRAWLDRREMRPGQIDWDDQLVEAIRSCDGLLFVMTADSVRSGSGCKDEWVRALTYKKPIVPLRFHADAELPFRLGSRQFIDFSANVTSGLAQLRDFLGWRSTPEGLLQELCHQLADAERELPRASEAQRPRLEEDLERLRRRIDEQRRLVEDPEAAREQTETRIRTALERERRPERPDSAAPRAKFVNPPPMTAPSYFQDRHIETGLIGDFLRDDGLRLMVVVGRGGVGKTAMVCRLLKTLERGVLPDELGELAVDGIVYLSQLGGHPINFPNLFADLCRLLPADVADQLLERYRDPHETPMVLMLALLEAFPSGRTVVLLDNFEELVDAAGVGLTDAALAEALRAVLTAPAHGVKVIVTTRIAPQGLILAQPAVQDRLDLDAGLPSPHAETLLRARDPSGRLGLRDAQDGLLAEARTRTRGFPRALEALAGILAADRNTTLPELLAETARMPENVVEALVGEGFNRLDALAQRVMQALAIYTTPVPPVAVDYALQPYAPAIDSTPVLARLVNMQFVRRDAGRYYLHQVDREYALHRVALGEPSDRHADSPPFSQCALRVRAADYFEQTRTPRETWRTLDDVTPQLAEFELRCEAGDFDAAAQVLNGVSVEYLQKWGHVGLARDMHERVQGHLSDPATSAASLNYLGFAYQSLGETPRSIDVHNQALEISRELGDRHGEGIALTGLGNALLTSGEVRLAIDCYHEALNIDREIGYRDSEAVDLGTLGAAYRALGDSRRAIEFHEQALLIYRETGHRSGEGATLNSLGGAYETLGEPRRAIEFYDEALTIARETDSRTGEASALHSLGAAAHALGDVQRGIEFSEQALAIYREIGHRSGEAGAVSSVAIGRYRLGETRRAIELLERTLIVYREIGDRIGEAGALGNLGSVHYTMGDVARAIEFYEQALAALREIGDRAEEGGTLCNLGEAHAALGDAQRAIEFYEQALAVSRETGYRVAEAITLIYLGAASADAGYWPQAIRRIEEGVQIADQVGHAQGSSEGRVYLAMTHAARAYDHAPTSDNVALVVGIALLRQGRLGGAREAFREASSAAESLLAHTHDSYDELDTKGLALCGLALLEDETRVDGAIEAFRAARALTRAEGIVARVLRLFDILAARDEAGILAPVRPAAAGEP
jgi:tetratricopeptide (TPR) repeat protein